MSPSRLLRGLLTTGAVLAGLLVPGTVATPALAPVADVQPAFPIRATFYYGWYPWGFADPGTHFHPSAGRYDTSNVAVLRSQVDQMTYAGMNAAFYSWWGRGSWADQRFPVALRAADGTAFRWALYYELEGGKYPNPSASKIRSDLLYIQAKFGHDPNYLRVGGKPVIFVWTENDTCDAANRWAAANYDHRFYVSLKVVSGYSGCAHQPDTWHWYAPARDRLRVGSTYSISPGFYDVHDSAPRLGRSPSRWAYDISAMKASKARWQLVTTWNEWAEGTSVESAAEWASWTHRGRYVDLLHAGLGSAPNTPPTPTGVSATSGAGGATVGWRAVSGADSYRVLRNGCVVATSSGTSYVDTSAPADSTNAYSVEAVNALGPSRPSVQVEASSGTPAPAPAAAGARFVPLAARVLDTRTGAGVGCRGARSGLVEFTVPSSVPPDATAVALDLTALGAIGPGTVATRPTQATGHTVSTAYDFDQDRTNLVVAPVGTGRQVTVDLHGAPAHLVGDLVGYFTTDPAAGQFSASTGRRFVDTRSGLGGVPEGAVTSATFAVPSAVPADATGVALTVLVYRPAGTGWLTLAPASTSGAAPTVMNFPAARTTSTTALSPLGSDRKVTVTLSQRAYLVVGLAGWWAPGSGGVHVVTSQRVLDSRDGTGVSRGRKVGTVNVALPSSVPAGADVLFEVGTVGASTYGTATAYGYGASANDMVQQVSFGPAKGEISLALVHLQPGSHIASVNLSQAAYLYVDLVGWSTG